MDDLYDSLYFVKIPFQDFDAHSEMRVLETVAIVSEKVLTIWSEFA